MSEIFKKKVVYHDFIEYEVSKKCVAVSLWRTGFKKKRVSYFVSRVEWDKAVIKYKDDLIRAANSLESYDYYKSKAWDEFDKDGYFFNDYDKYDPLDIIKSKEFDIRKVVRLDYSSHLIYSIGNINPITRVYNFDYISGNITNRDFDLKKAKKILDDHNLVSNVKIISIPYYNAEDGRDQAIEFSVKLPQSKFNKLCNYFRDIRKAKFWTCRVKDSIVYRGYGSEAPYKNNILGLKKAYIGEDI